MFLQGLIIINMDVCWIVLDEEGFVMIAAQEPIVIPVLANHA
jgi:hypothetical protein